MPTNPSTLILYLSNTQLAKVGSTRTTKYKTCSSGNGLRRVNSLTRAEQSSCCPPGFIRY